MDDALQSWAEYVDLLKPAGELADLTWHPDSEQLRAEVHRQLLMNVALGYFLYFQSDADHPDWAPFLNSVFMLQPNPDDCYLLAPVRGDGVYRVSGERGSVHLLTFVTGRGMMGMSETPGEGFGEYTADDLQLAEDGSFEVIFSSEQPNGHSGNWWRLDPRADYIMVRQRSYDWGRERDARLAIERLDAPALKPAMDKTRIAANMRALLGGFTERLSRMWLVHQNRLRERGLINALEFFPFAGGVKVQAYWQGVFEFEPGEALILETELPHTRPYWNVQLNDPLFNAVEFVYRQSSLNGQQARIDSDGKFRAVIAAEDPGVPNWLDTGGYLQGTLIGRWYACSSQPLPTLKKVGLSELRAHLPADTPTVSAAEREAALRQRRAGAQLRRRW